MKKMIKKAVKDISGGIVKGFTDFYKPALETKKKNDRRLMRR